jgi:hypothetical protein
MKTSELLWETEFLKWRESFRADLPKDDAACLEVYRRFTSGKVREGVEILNAERAREATK